MPTLAEVYAKAKFLYEQGPAHHSRKCHFGLVDVEAKERILNPRKYRRIVISTDEQNYSEFAAMREAYSVTLNENPTLVVQAIIEAMKEFDVKGWFEKQNEASESLGDA
jgi:hypothetical protein